MGTEAIYDLLISAVGEAITEPWTIAELTIHYLMSSQDVEFSGTYLDASGEAQVLSTEFSDEVVEAVQLLFASRATDGNPRSNCLELTISTLGRFTTDYSWDQEIQDEDDHFSKGGTVKEWVAFRTEKYGPLPEQD